jgi:hypothetical protein
MYLYPAFNQKKGQLPSETMDDAKKGTNFDLQPLISTNLALFCRDQEKSSE